MRLVSLPLLLITCAVACREKSSKAAAENPRKPAGDAEIGVYCVPSLDKLKTGDAPICSYLVRWSGEPPLYRDDPYYRAPITFASSDSSILGPQFPFASRVVSSDSSVPERAPTMLGAPLYAHKPGRARLTARVRDKVVELPVIVEAAPPPPPATRKVP